jgi:hypothetical protein
MNTKRTILGLFIVLLFIVPTATAGSDGFCCTWAKTSNTSDWGCIGSCQTGECREIAEGQCNCTLSVIPEVKITTILPPEPCGLQQYKLTDTLVAGAEGQCGGYCDNGGDCMPTDVVGTAASCYCRPPVSVPEFATGAIALAVMLMSPAFAYLVIRKRH